MRNWGLQPKAYTRHFDNIFINLNYIIEGYFTILYQHPWQAKNRVSRYANSRGYVTLHELQPNINN